MNIKVSVLMSVKDGGQYLKESIESILNQSYKNLEFLICDDGSTDNSHQICCEYSNLENRVKIISNKESIGLTKSLNKLIDISTGSVVARQDADDFSDINRISKQIELYKKGNEIITSRAFVIGENKIKPRFSYLVPKKIMIRKKNNFVHGTLFIKKKILLDIGCYDESFYYAQDYKLFSDLLRQGYKIKTILNPLYYVRNEGNISTTKLKEQNHFSDLVRKSQKK